MVDCADRERIDEARQELHRIANDREMKDAVVLIFANKQDLPQGVCVCVHMCVDRIMTTARVGIRELSMSIPGSINTNCRTFRPNGPCQLQT